MVPNINILSTEFEEVKVPSRTYKIEVTDGEADDRLVGYTDDSSAIQQAIYIILNTERYQHPIYSWNFGVEFLDLIGKPLPYVMSEIPRRVNEALTQDERIKGVRDFTFEKGKKSLHVTCIADTVVGAIPVEVEVTT